MDRLVFKVKRPERRGAGCVIRISDEAMAIVEDIQAKTGHSAIHIATEMIIFADEHCIVEYE